MKLELGAGHRPTPGYLHNDLHPLPHIEFVGEAWMIHGHDDMYDEILALAFIEHLTYDNALDTFRAVRKMLRKDGVFYFDVPDYPTWAAYYLDRVTGKYQMYDEAPEVALIRRTLFGWQRFPGDAHLYGWDRVHLEESLNLCGLTVTSWSVEPFLTRAHRDRFTQPWNAHLYVTAAPA